MLIEECWIQFGRIGFSEPAFESIERRLNSLLQSQNKHQALINQKNSLSTKQDELSARCADLNREITTAAEETSIALEKIVDRVNHITKSQCASQKKLSDNVGFLQRHLHTTWLKWTGLLNDWRQRETRFNGRLEHNRQLKETLGTELEELSYCRIRFRGNNTESQNKINKRLAIHGSSFDSVV